MRYRIGLFSLIALLIGSTAYAANYDGQYVLSKPLGVQLSGVALNASAATRTITIVPAQQYARVLFTVNFTYAAATTVTITPTCTDSASTTKGSILSGNVASGVSTDVAYTRSVATGSASMNFQWNFGIAGEHTCSFVFAGASAGASDLVTVSATLVTR